MSKSWVVALQLPVGRHGWARIWSQKELGVSLWHLRWMEAGSGTSVTMFGGCSMPSSINRIPAGAEMLMATAVGCVLCHTWQMKAVSGTTSTILRPWLWLRLGLAPDVFFQMASRTFPRKNSEIMQSSSCIALARSGCD